ncbi:MAG: DNA-directed RNA polymerase subunit alpha, partial [Patescibacteria group bacterium]
MHIIQKEIGLPKISAKKVGDNHTLFTVAPLPNGYGMTLGNAFRRVLLSSLPGAAVAAVKVKGATHEYSTLSGVKDSLLNSLLNLKQLNIKKYSKKPTILKLEVKNRSGEVRAKDISKDADVEILNPDLVITTLDKKSELKMEIVVEKGVGYLPAAERQKNNKEVGLI